MGLHSIWHVRNARAWGDTILGQVMGQVQWNDQSICAPSERTSNLELVTLNFANRSSVWFCHCGVLSKMGDTNIYLMARKWYDLSLNQGCCIPCLCLPEFVIRNGPANQTINHSFFDHLNWLLPSYYSCGWLRQVLCVVTNSHVPMTIAWWCYKLSEIKPARSKCGI